MRVEANLAQVRQYKDITDTVINGIGRVHSHACWQSHAGQCVSAKYLRMQRFVFELQSVERWFGRL